MEPPAAFRQRGQLGQKAVIPEPKSPYQASMGARLALISLKKNDAFEEASDYIDGLGRADRDIEFARAVIDYLLQQDERMRISAFQLFISWDRGQPWYDKKS